MLAQKKCEENDEMRKEPNLTMKENKQNYRNRRSHMNKRSRTRECSSVGSAKQSNFVSAGHAHFRTNV